MKVKEKYIKLFKKVLKKENLKFTNQRFMIFKILFENKGHFDCEEVISLLPDNIKAKDYFKKM